MPRTRRRALLGVAALLALAPLVTTNGTDAADDRAGVPGIAPQDERSVRTALDLKPLVGPQRRPNIVVIMTDDMRADELRFMPKTRRLIGEQGVRFSNSFSPYPLCCPARASFLTGLYTHNHGVWSNFKPYGFGAFDDASTLPVWLSEVGYQTLFLGKYLNGYGGEPTPDGSPGPTYVPPGWTDWQGATSGTYHMLNTTLNENGAEVSYRGRYQTHVFGAKSERLVAEYARSPKPFFLWASYVAPHIALPYEPDDPRPVTRDDGSTHDFRTPARPPRVRGTFDSVITEAPGAEGEQDVSDKPSFIRATPPITVPEKEALLELARQRAEALSVVDDQVERTIKALRETGELEDTLVVFTSDNGYFLGEHRRRQGKVLPYEPSLRVPLLMRGPGIPAGEVRADPFLTTDLAPTFLQAAGARERNLDGTGRLGVARDGDRGWKRPVFTETGPRRGDAGAVDRATWLTDADGPSAKRFSQGVRTPKYLYVEHASREQELYDLDTDPGQLVNLAGRDATASVQRELARVLESLRSCRGDQCREPLPAELQAG